MVPGFSSLDHSISEFLPEKQASSRWNNGLSGLFGFFVKGDVGSEATYGVALVKSVGSVGRQRHRDRTARHLRCRLRIGPSGLEELPPKRD